MECKLIGYNVVHWRKSKENNTGRGKKTIILYSNDAQFWHMEKETYGQPSNPGHGSLKAGVGPSTVIKMLPNQNTGADIITHMRRHQCRGRVNKWLQ